MEFPLVSIIVPMYNTAGCIARCVKSICAQTYKSIEILLLNDGSTDDTLAVCRALAASDHRIALVDKTNTGAADTRNQGIALDHGKYIQFVDSDDWLAPDFTEKLVSAAEAHTADLVIAPFWMVYPENYVEHIRPWEKALQHVLQRNPPRTRAYGYLPAGVYTGQEYAKHLIQKPNTFYYGSPCNKLYRRDLLRNHSLHFRMRSSCFLSFCPVTGYAIELQCLLKKLLQACCSSVLIRTLCLYSDLLTALYTERHKHHQLSCGCLAVSLYDRNG